MTRIERDDYALGTEPRNPAFHDFGLAHRDAADDDTRHAGIEQALHAGFVAHAASGLHRQPSGPGDRLDRAQVGELAGAGAIQIDHVQPARPRLRVAVRKRDGVHGVAGFTRIVALTQAHDVSIAQIDGRHDLHGHSSRKFRNNLEPTAPERSG